MSCDVKKCETPTPAETYKITVGSRTYEVDLCGWHYARASVREAVALGRDVTKLREAERIIPTDRQELIDSLKD